MNLFGVFFVHPRVRLSKRLINHESIHTAQMREMLYVPFYVVYVIEWLIRLLLKGDAYRNISFERGDATHLDFPDESFDAVVSNYVYHNIPGDRQAYLLETLRVLKKGGMFAIHDIFSKAKYGDMQAFVKKLKDMGYADVRLIDTTDGTWITKWESVWMELAGSALLIGKK